jgi:hypothetical protein
MTAMISSHVKKLMGLFGKDMYKTEQSSRLLVLKLVKSDDVI